MGKPEDIEKNDYQLPDDGGGSPDDSLRKIAERYVTDGAFRKQIDSDPLGEIESILDRPLTADEARIVIKGHQLSLDDMRHVLRTEWSAGQAALAWY